MIAFALVMALAAPQETQQVRRYAFVVGSNDGGKDRVRLRYANTDALSLSRVLLELGGVQEIDLVLLRDANEPVFRAALRELSARIAREHRSNERAELFLYYSGHSDEEGLLLGGSRLGYPELRGLIAAMPADVKVAILDSCASGALVRQKGGERRAAFLVDASARARGHAYITSSSADEAAQESDRIAGSFFTHFLVSGLRGAADTTGDKRVTLNEAYHYAFNETLQRTERTQSGPQHPSYDIQLAGSGDLVMTDVRSTKAGIVFDEPVDGRLFVRDDAGRLIVEVDKPAGRRVEIGLGAGKYAITRERSGSLTVAQTAVQDGQRLSIDEDAFVRVDRERTVRRGDDPVTEPSTTPSYVPEEKREVTGRVPFVAGAFGPFHSARRFSVEPHARVMLQALHLRVRQLDGVAFGLGLSEVHEQANGFMWAFTANKTGGRMRGVQLAFGANFARDLVYGAQASAIFNYAEAVRGVQASSVNIARGAPGQVKAAVIGAQLGLIGNLSYDWVRGAQLSPLFNYAVSFTGIQASTVNAAGGMRGFQIGLVNYASNVEKGFQLGLINIAKHSDGAQLGLFSYAGNVPVRFQLYTSDVNAFNVAVKYGSKHLYGVVLGGLQPFLGPPRGSVGLGIGVHVPFWHLWLDVDASAQLLFVQPVLVGAAYMHGQVRGMLGAQIVDRFGIFVGATFNVSAMPITLLRDDESVRNVTYVPRTTVTGTAIQVWPGFIAGIQI